MSKRVAMVGTRFDTMGGISSVVDVYRRAGLFDRWPLTYIASHRDGGGLKKLTQMIAGLARFLAMLVTGQVGLVHIHISSRASTWRKCLFAFPAYWAGVPVILHLHGSDMVVFYEQECGPRRQRIIRALFDRAARLVVLSESWADWLRDLTVNRNIVAIYNPVIVPPATPWAARHPGEVLFLGRLGERKGAYDLVAGFATAQAAHPGARMLMGGDGEVAEVKAAADAAGCGDAVTMLGWVRGNDRDRYLAEAMVYALPSYREGLPMGLLEAMAAGLPVLTCPIAGIPEAVDDEVEGFLVTPGDTAAIADRLKRLIGDPALAERMGASARDRVERCFSAEAIIPRVEKIYAELLQAA